jgi:hypothetical protein
MINSLSLRALLAGVVFCNAVPAAAQMAESHPSDSEKTCRQALEKVSAAVVKMPSGVEKVSAQKEMDAAKLRMANGDMVGCNSHAQNAMQAIGTKSPP